MEASMPYCRWYLAARASVKQSIETISHMVLRFVWNIPQFWFNTTVSTVDSSNFHSLTSFCFEASTNLENIVQLRRALQQSPTNCHFSISVLYLGLFEMKCHSHCFVLLHLQHIQCISYTPLSWFNSYNTLFSCLFYYSDTRLNGALFESAFCV